MLVNVAIIIVACIVSLFIFWRFLKEDYLEEQIFTVFFYILAGGLLGFLVSRFIWGDYIFWLILILACVSFLLAWFKHRFAFYEFLEALIKSAIFFSAILIFSLSLLSKDFIGLVLFLANLIVIIIYYFLAMNYKKFIWYKSGKIGFAGLTTAGIFFVLRGFLVFVFPNMVSFSGSLEPILSGVTSFIFFMMLYNLSRQ